MALKSEVLSAHTWERQISFVSNLMEFALVHLHNLAYPANIFNKWIDIS